MKKYALCIMFFLVSASTVSWASLPAERTFPADSGMLNVKTVYGAVGDGLTDDTAAIQAAISANIRKQTTSRIIYFPAGTYLVTQPLVWMDTTHTWQSELTFQGENEKKTILKLSDRNSNFQNTASPNAVIETASLNPSGPNSTAGGGNNGFDNYFFDLTIDVGQENPGAIALNFLGNNYCGLRNVTLRSSDTGHAGSVGLNMDRYATGPCLMKNVSIDGFDYGVKAAQMEYSITFENLTLKHQKIVGISNTDNVLSIRNLTSHNKVPAVQNFGSYISNLTGLVTIIGANLLGGSSKVAAIENYQTLYARNVVSDGYSAAIQDSAGNPAMWTPVTEYDSGPAYSLFGGGSSSLNLPVEETPEFEETNLANWKSVVSYGADPTGLQDSSVAVQAAIDSGSTTVYFPAGQYIITTPIIVRGNVRMIEGFDSNILPNGPTFAGTTVNPLLVFQNTVDVIVSHIRFGPGAGNISYPGLRYMENDSDHSVTIRNTVFNRLNPGSVYSNGVNGTGTLFLEDVVGSYFEIQYPQHVFARQLDTEGATQKILNNGGTLWILGLKTERGSDSTHVAGIIDTESGGSTELLGGLVYTVTAAIPVNQAAFVITDSQASLIYAVSVHNPISSDPLTPDGDFKTQVQETQAGVVMNLTSAAIAAQTPRGQGVMMPLYTNHP